MQTMRQGKSVITAIIKAVGLNLEIKCHHQDYRRHAAALTRALAEIDPEITLISSFDVGCLAAVMPELPQIARAGSACTLAIWPHQPVHRLGRSHR